ncbi:MAG: hypothetical protein JRI22_16280 [Deltaproteobacteria bacterium]|nr:hypothetical protein [Deltaproteobacteria bacterium]
MGSLWNKSLPKPGREFSWIVLITLVVALMSGCRGGTSVFPLKVFAIPGAQLAGTDQCSACHEDVAQRFKHSEHYRSLAVDEESSQRICESCHGAGSLHADKAAEGRPETARFIFRENSDACFTCHLDIRARFSLPYRHPVSQGRVQCSSCHDIHGEKLTRRLWSSGQETCFQCHPEVRGPFVWEHEAVLEGCENCHFPHGSPRRKLLTQDGRNLCLKCHVTSGFPQIGTFNHRAALSATARCVDCHTRIHGSNFSRALLSQ